MLPRIKHLLTTLPPHKLAAKAGAKLGRATKHRLEEAVVRLRPSVLSDDAFACDVLALPQQGGAAESLLQLSCRPRWPHQVGDEEFFSALKTRFAGPKPDDIREAEAACEGQIRLPGGVFGDYGMPPNWLRDPVTGYEWPLTFHKRVREGTPDVDILNLWWAGSFYHLLPLAKGYAWARCDGEGGAAERFSGAVVAHIESWQKQNPYGFGPHWGSPTIVAIRLLHFIWTLAFFSTSNMVRAAFLIALLKDIHRHARHIRSNLEWFPVRTNHYLTNLHALYVTGHLFPEFREAKEWREFAHAELIREAEHYILDDGAVHEGSVGYHRFVLEIFLTSLVFGEARGDEFPEDFRDRLERAVSFLALCVRPDGTLPRIGDGADIRLQHLDQRDYFADAGHVLNLAAALFGRGDFKAAAPHFSEHAFWLLGATGAETFESLAAEPSRPRTEAFRDGGYLIHGDGENWLMMRAGPLALGGVAGHGHYDQLAFEFWFRGRAILIDPGWYRYEGDAEAYRYFKSTAAHNTVTVDGRDQIAMDIFLYPPPQRPVPRLLEVEDKDGALSVTGTHALYFDLDDPVTHRRAIRFDPSNGELAITDRLEGAAEHALAWTFHFAPALDVSIDGNRAVFEDGAIAGAIESGAPMAPEMEPGFDAPVYGHRHETRLVRFFLAARLPVERRFVIRLDPNGQKEVRK